MGKIIACLFLSFILLSCEGESDFAEKKFSELPKDVRIKFKSIYNFVDKNNPDFMPAFSECANVDSKYDCSIDYKYHNPFLTMIIPQKFVITSCGKKAEVPFFILERVFIVKNDSIYYPFTPNGGVIATDEPRSTYIKIDTLKFHVKKMIKE